MGIFYNNCTCMKKNEWILILSGFFLIIFFLIYKELNPFDSFLFDYHDITQPARVQEFTFNLLKFKLPPRMAPHFLFNLGYPVFNFYAPFSYWVSSLFTLLGIGADRAVELAFSTALLLGFCGMYFLLREYFSKAAAFLGSVVYVTSPYLAVEIFVRGNLGEVWFWALFPWALYFLKHENFLGSFFVLHAVFTVHNIFSLVSLPIFVLWVVIRRSIKGLTFIFLGLISASYFLLPAILESRYVLASEVAKMTRYWEHFLCIKQLWTSPAWLYGASLPGCNDSMSFKLGKGQIIIGLFGLGVFLLDLFLRRVKGEKRRELVFLLLVSLFATFLTLYQSQFIWKVFEKVLAVFQFPWRFLLFSLFGLGVFSAYFIDKIEFKLIRGIIALTLSLTLFVINDKYFFKPLKELRYFRSLYLNKRVIEEEMVFKIPEYFTQFSDLKRWKRVRKGETKFKSGVIQGDVVVLEKEVEPFYKKVRIKAKRRTEVSFGILYFPYWKIFKDGKRVVPEKFDAYGRPRFVLEKGEDLLLEAVYEQTLVEKIGNAFTVLTFAIVLYLARKRESFLKL